MSRVVVSGLGVVSPYGAGTKTFWAGLAAGACAIRPITLIDTEGFRSPVAQRGDVLGGVGAPRPPAHLFHLFVAETAQRQGLARRMWETVQAWVEPSAPITVNASRHALAVYRQLGFEATGPELCEHGIVFTPMLWRPPA